MASSEEDVSLFENFTNKIETGYQEACNKFNELVDKLNSFKMRLLMGGSALGWYIRSQMEKLAEGFQRLKEYVDELSKHHLPIVSLMRTSSAWIKVKGQVSDCSSRCTTPATANLNNWTGPAKVTYTEKAGLMKDAVDEVTGRADYVSEWLGKVAQKNVEYVTGLAKRVTDLISKLVDAVATSLNVISISEAIGKAAGCITKNALDALLDLGDQLTKALNNENALDRRGVDESKLPGAVWPQVVKG